MFTVQIIKLDNVRNLEHAAELLERSQILDETVDDEEWPTHEPLTKRWNAAPYFDPGINEITAGTRENIRVMFAEGYNERYKRKESWYDDEDGGDELVPKENRINISKYNSIFFEYDDNVYVAPIMPLTGPLSTYIGDLLPEEIWGVHTKEPNDYKMSKDFFYWLLNIFTRKNKLVASDPQIRIRSWTGFHGMTQDTIHKLSGEGDQISAILGTLAFLFMDDPFKSLNVSIQFKNERIPVVLWATGSLTIDDALYEGIFANGFFHEKQKVLLAVLLYTQVLPELFKAYTSDKKSDKWNEKIKEDFRNYIGDQIISRVKSELQI
ncbi:hypothetical protein D3C75_332110 [compost metagenome]